MSAQLSPRQLLAASIAGALLSGCGSLSQNMGYTGVGIPTPAQITAYYRDTELGTLVDGTGRRITVSEYLFTSLTYTNEKCHLFFETLEAFRQDSTFLDQVLTAAVAAGSPLLALSSSATAKHVAHVTSGISLANLLNKYTADIYAFATYKDSLKTHVFQALTHYQEIKGLDLLLQAQYGIYNPVSESGDDVTVRLGTKRLVTFNKKTLVEFLSSKDATNFMIARSMVADYAAICSLANMRLIVAQALAATESRATTGRSPTSPSVIRVVPKK